ncbi:hypothetical protein M569_08576, partial [Genlisea aurea]
MCGIALIISGIEICWSHSIQIDASLPASRLTSPSLFSEEDLKASLLRRGPDSIGTGIICLHTSVSSDERNDFVLQSRLAGEEDEAIEPERELRGELILIGATLQLRGLAPVAQPLTDAVQNVLVYNGEIFGGIHVSSCRNDTEILMEALGRCCSCLSHEGNGSSCFFTTGKESVPELLSRIRGPWGLIYWQDSSKTLWFGRDAFGRRSILVHWPTRDDPRLLLSSVSPPSSIQQDHDFSYRSGMVGVNYWEELPCGIYSTSISAAKARGSLIGEVKKHEWNDGELKKLISWERTLVEPIPGNLPFLPITKSSWSLISGVPVEASRKVLMALEESVMRRAIFGRDEFPKIGAPVGVLFSGGLDSMIIAALLHRCISSEYEIDLLNVSFDSEAAPDRISAREGLKELQKVSPSRRWNLVEIDADLQKLSSETKHVMALISPAKTYM